jgi:tetratricopeptide (TPR) repeat protein
MQRMDADSRVDAGVIEEATWLTRRLATDGHLEAAVSLAEAVKRAQRASLCEEERLQADAKRLHADLVDEVRRTVLAIDEAYSISGAGGDGRLAVDRLLVIIERAGVTSYLFERAMLRMIEHLEAVGANGAAIEFTRLRLRVLDAVDDRSGVRSFYEGMMPRNLWRCGEFEEALTCLDRADAEARKRVPGYRSAPDLELRAMILASLGRWEEAEVVVSEALRCLAEHNVANRDATLRWIDALERLRGEIQRRTFEPPS